MDCLFGTCRRPSENHITCDNCQIPKYCSEQCKRKDSTYHETWCRPRTFSLNDFTPVKTSRKVMEIGTYGEVQLMQNRVNSLQYAIKTIRKSLVSDVIPLKVLLREIMIHKTLVHPNIVRLVDHFEDTSKIYLVLEFVEKGSLFDLIRQKAKLSETEACEIFTQICTGLNYLHQNEVVHRDIKPENILISKDGTIKICDFGWSASQNEKRVTFCGSLDYMSPEMINSEPHTSKLDIWAVGVLLHEMINGTPPYQGKSLKEQYKMIASGSFAVEAHVSKSASQLIRSILQLKPNDRPSVVEILQSEWVQESSGSKLQRDWRVNDLKQGEGFIESIVGKVAKVNIKGKVHQMLEVEVLRNCFIYDQTHRLIHTPPEDQFLYPKFDPQNLPPVNPLYKKLGIDSNRANPVTGRATPNKSKPHPRASSNHEPALEQPNPSTQSTGTLRKYPVTPKKPAIPRSSSSAARPKMSEFEAGETKRNIILNDFSEINIKTNFITSANNRAKPKSSFLAKFKAK